MCFLWKNNSVEYFFGIKFYPKKFVKHVALRKPFGIENAFIKNAVKEFKLERDPGFIDIM